MAMFRELLLGNDCENSKKIISTPPKPKPKKRITDLGKKDDMIPCGVRMGCRSSRQPRTRDLGGAFNGCEYYYEMCRGRTGVWRLVLSLPKRASCIPFLLHGRRHDQSAPKICDGAEPHCHRELINLSVRRISVEKRLHYHSFLIPKFIKESFYLYRFPHFSRIFLIKVY